MWPFKEGPPRWRYKRIILRGGSSINNMNKLFDSKGKEIEDKLNVLGKDGWELVAITRLHSTPEAERQLLRECIFKKKA